MTTNVLRTNVDKAPVICKDYKELEVQVKAIMPYQDLCIMIHDVLNPGENPEGKRTPYLVFFPLDSSGNPILTNPVGFKLPCPPYCSDVTPVGKLSIVVG